MRAALAALALLVSACGSTVPLTTQGGPGQLAGPDGLGPPVLTTQVPAAGVAGPATPTTGTSRPVAPGAPLGATPVSPTLPSTSAPATVATRVRSPIKLGVVDLAPSGAAAAAIGVTSADEVSGEEAVKALVRGLNAAGGLAGRRIDLVEETVDTTSDNYEVELAAACQSFVNDSHVDVVVSNTNSGFYETFEQCLTKAGLPHVASFGAGAADEASYRSHPGLFSTGAPSVERRIAAVLEGLSTSGFLGPEHPMGVIVEACGYNTRAYDRAFVPLAKRLGLSVQKRVVDCAVGFSDAAKLQSQVSSAVLPFRSAGVDRVLLLSQFEGFGLLGFTSAAESQDYHPGYAISSTALITQLAPSMRPGQLPGMRGIGWQPDVDVTEHVQASGATKRCRSLLAGQGVRPATKVDDQTVDLTCAPFFLLEELLRRTAGVSTRDALLPAVAALGTGFVSPLELTGATSYTSIRRDGTSLFAPFGYVGSCSCFRYSGKGTTR